MWLESWTAGKSEPTQISRGGAGLSLNGIRPVWGSFRGRAQGRAQGRRFVIRSEGGGSQKPWGEDHNPPSHFSPALFWFLELDRTTRTALAEREKRERPPFLTAGAVSRGGRSRRIYPCGKAPRPARGPDDDDQDDDQDRAHKPADRRPVPHRQSCGSSPSGTVAKGNFSALNAPCRSGPDVSPEGPQRSEGRRSR